MVDEDDIFEKSERVEAIGREKKKEIIDQLIFFENKTSKSADPLSVPVVTILPASCARLSNSRYFRIDDLWPRYLCL